MILHFYVCHTACVYTYICLIYVWYIYMYDISMIYIYAGKNDIRLSYVQHRYIFCLRIYLKYTYIIYMYFYNVCVWVCLKIRMGRFRAKFCQWIFGVGFMVDASQANPTIGNGYAANMKKHDSYRSTPSFLHGKAGFPDFRQVIVCPQQT